MNKLIVGFLLTGSAMVANSSPVHDWWVQCKGSYSESTCLSDTELSKFKTICSNKSFKADCNMVVEYTVAKNRAAEGKLFLTKGFASQVSSYSANKKYLTAIEKIWEQDSINSESFAVGILPSCNSAGAKKLVFGKNLRPQVKELQNQFLKIYETLASIPCPDQKSGFVLVAIGKVHDSKNEFEIFTLDENKNFKIINTSLGSGPFYSLAQNSK